MSQEQPLDLSITLTKPLPGSQLGAIATLDIRCDILGVLHTGDQLDDPLKPNERNELQWYLEEYWKWPYEGFAARGRKVEQLLAEIGKRFYRAVFRSADARDIVQAWRLHPSTKRQISIVSDIPQILSLPWELLHDGQGFLVLRTRHPVSIVRRLPLSQLAAFPVSFAPPLRILLVTARPRGTGFVNPRSIARELLDEVQNQIEAGTIELEFLRPPTLSALRHRLGDLKRPSIHIFHFDGHGTFAPDGLPLDELRLHGGSQGMLAFEDDEGKLELVKAEDVGQVLQHSGVRLAVITACQSAMSTSDDAFSSVAARLIQGGLDAVVAMSASVLVVSAARYAETFYRGIANSLPVPIAHERARQALYDNPRRHVHRRHRSEEGRPVELRDWWLPYFFQQRPLTLRSNQRTRRSKKQLPDALIPRFNESMPQAPRYGFSGRAYELLQVERYLLHRKLVIIHGFGGVGKTTFARETADWLTRTKMYSRACFISFEHGGDATMLLSTLGHFLDIYDGSYDPNDTTTALARLGPILKERSLLVIADNIESILPTGEAPLESERRTQLWDVMLALLNLGVGVILTSRGVAFNDGKLAPGRQVSYLALEGLQPDDAYELANNILIDLDIDRSRIPYAALQDLLKQLDYHPLAIQLVLPTLQKSSIAKIQSDFGVLLDSFIDDKTTGRNRSLLASLAYSLRELSEEQRALLSRLILFEGGAFEHNLLEITQIPENEWINLCSTLEQSALLTEERVIAAWDLLQAPSSRATQSLERTLEAFRNQTFVAFLRFHPILVPYLRSLHDINGDKELHQRYGFIYRTMAASWSYYSGVRSVQAAMWWELPNMRHAMESLVRDGEIYVAADLADSLALFLSDFGLVRERDALWKRFDEITGTASKGVDGVLTPIERYREQALIEEEIQKGNIKVALERTRNLLRRIEALPEGSSEGYGSSVHVAALYNLARCLLLNEQADAAEEYLHKALTITPALLNKKRFDGKTSDEAINLHASLLNCLIWALTKKGAYFKHAAMLDQAEETFNQAEKVFQDLIEFHSKTIVVHVSVLNEAKANLATLALARGDTIRAQKLYTKLLDDLDDPYRRAVIWYHLGLIADEQSDWSKAVDCFRESLTLSEQTNQHFLIARVCEALAEVALQEGRHEEAKIWHQRSLSARSEE
jgi:tetratricopeptide (TPR) repeat protein